MAEDAVHAVRDRMARGWTQGAVARDAGGREVSIVSEEACAWSVCSAFALAAKDGIPMNHIADALRAFGDVTSATSLEAWNDDPSRTHQEVLEASLARVSSEDA